MDELNTIFPIEPRFRRKEGVPISAINSNLPLDINNLRRSLVNVAQKYWYILINNMRGGDRVAQPIITNDQLQEFLSRTDTTTAAEELVSHRKGHWFESSIAHLSIH
jgi:hypothetical protein